MKYITSFLYIISILTLYPSLLGAKFSLIGVVSLVFLTPLSLFKFKKGNKDLGFILVTWIFIFFISSSINLGSNVSSVIIFTVVLSLFSFNTFILFSNATELSRIHNVFLVVLLLQALSCAVTFLLVLTGMDINSLLLLDFMPNDRVPGNIYFPMSFGGTYFTTPGFQFIRFSSFFREPGVSQILYVYFIGYLLCFRERSFVLILLLFIGLVTSLSTTFLITLPVLISIYYLYKSKRLYSKTIILLLSPLILLALYKAPFFGLEEKLVTHTSAVSDRVAAFDYLADTLNDTYMIGSGMFSEGEIENASINFILSLRENGVFGVFLFFILYFLPYFYLKRDGRYIFLLLTSPFVITVLFAQPIFYSVINIFVFSGALMLALSNREVLKSEE